MLPPIFRLPPSSRSRATPRRSTTTLFRRTGSATAICTPLVPTTPETPPQSSGEPEMAGENNDNEAPPSLRDIAEQAYDDLENAVEPQEGESPEGEAPAEEPLASEERPRDKSGRWVAKSEAQPGEAIKQSPADPAPKPKVSETQAPEPDPAAANRRRRAIRSPSTGAPKTKPLSRSCPRRVRPSS